MAAVQYQIHHVIIPAAAEIISRCAPTPEELDSISGFLQKIASLDYEELLRRHKNFERFVNDEAIPEKAKTYVLQLDLVECRQIIDDYYSRSAGDRISLLANLERLGEACFGTEDNAEQPPKNSLIKRIKEELIVMALAASVIDGGQFLLQEAASALQEVIQTSEKSKFQPGPLSETLLQAPPIAGCQNEEPPQDKDLCKSEDPGCSKNTQ